MISLELVLLAVSHLVTTVNNAGSCPRTLKFMEAVLRGVWVVNLDCKYPGLIFLPVLNITLYQLSSQQFP